MEKGAMEEEAVGSRGLAKGVEVEGGLGEMVAGLAAVGHADQ